MRLAALSLAVVLLASLGRQAWGADATICLSALEAQQSVSGGHAVPPGEAILAARRAVPQADILRAALCHAPNGLVYMLLALRRDGRLVHVTIDAPSGKVAALR